MDRAGSPGHQSVRRARPFLEPCWAAPVEARDIQWVDPSENKEIRVSDSFCFYCGAAIVQAPVYKPAPVGTLKQVMRGVVLPNSDILFSVAQTPPKNDKEWAVVQDSAIAISEAAALISMPVSASSRTDR